MSNDQTRVNGFTVSAGDPFGNPFIAEREKYRPDSKISHAEEFTRDDGSVYLVIYHRRDANKNAYLIPDAYNWA